MTSKLKFKIKIKQIILKKTNKVVNHNVFNFVGALSWIR